jgi:hypothetical protein
MNHLFLQTKLMVSSNLHYSVQKRVQLLSLLSMNKRIVFSYLNKRFYSDISTIYFHEHYSKFFLFLRATFCLTYSDYRLIWMTSLPSYSRLARFYVEA